jgi:CRISPR-associated protein Cmr6
VSQATMIANSHETLTPLFGGKYLPQNAHAGLVYDRYFRIWEGKPEDAIRVAELSGPLQGFVDAYNDRVRFNDLGPQLLFEHHRRLDRIGSALNIEKIAFAVRWRLACGLGGDHPTESGFTFDPVVGVPMISGSAVKGLCRRAAKMMETEPGLVEAFFGSEEVLQGDGGFQGDLIFYDAFPFQWPELCVDIVNCHHSKYYVSLGEVDKRRVRAPLETESPIPVFFITVDQDTPFAFRLASKSDSKDHLKRAAELLEIGLDLLGIGGKTAAGYGAFNKVTP